MYRPSPDLVLRKVGEEAILVPVRNRVGDLESIFTLNEVAYDVWQRLDGQSSTEAIAQSIATEYDVAPDIAFADIAELLNELELAGLVEKVGSRT